MQEDLNSKCFDFWGQRQGVMKVRVERLLFKDLGLSLGRGELLLDLRPEKISFREGVIFEGGGGAKGRPSFRLNGEWLIHQSQIELMIRGALVLPAMTDRSDILSIPWSESLREQPEFYQYSFSLTGDWMSPRVEKLTL